MTVISVNSISGINSITAQSGSLNFFDTTGNTLSIGASVSGNIVGNVTGNVNSTGVSTFSGGIVVSAGTTSVPSISPTGDSNTGIFFPSPDTVAIAEGGVEALRIDSSGNVGINTANPPDKLTVLGKIQVQQDSGSNNRIILRAQPSSSYRWNIDNYSSSNTFRIYREDDATSASGAVAMSIDASTRNVTISGGNLAFDSGKGIDFSAAGNAVGMTSELLNDYEEGTWTPTLTFGGASAGITYSTQYGYYTKIGNIVVYNVNITLSNKGTSSGSAYLTGLPFSISRSGNANSSSGIRIGNVTSITGGVIICNTYLGLQFFQNSSGDVNNTHFNNNTYMEFSVCGTVYP